ncbi:hypothetical protein TSUD_284980 [Trifolium subterraneum]|uniref:Uncharacterized protein n=1 Tax=Trifolium subterraneum TaxID=3900 RepID=A0A2Z6NXS9_TRISU|nr:hypothetical protein TSUD_284980 [Trifolium subterraneum]
MSKNLMMPGGFYRFVCHLTGMEDVEACEHVGDEVRKEMLEFHTSLQEVNEKGCVGVGEKREGNEVDARGNSLSQKTPTDVLFVMANSELGIEKKAPVEINLDDNGTVEGLDVDTLDLDTPCLKPQDDVADLHDANANGDGNEDEDGDEDEDEEEDEDGDEN